MSCSEPFIAIPIPGPLIHLGHMPLSLLYASSICFDYYICCCTSIPYHKYKHCLTLFHLLLPLIAEPINTAWTTVYIAYPWFLATVGIYVSRIHNKQNLSAQSWLKLIIVEGLGDKNQVENVQLDSIRKIVNVLCGLAFSRFFLKRFLPVNPQLLCEYPWYSFKSVYLCLLMGIKGYILMNCSSLGTTAIQAISGIKTVEVFNQPFLATSLQDFWGRRWNLIVRNLFFKQVYHHPSTVTSKNQWGRWRAFFISAVMHEIIMTLVNRHITLENFGFFMIQAIGVCMQRYFSLNLPKPFDQCLTLLYIALSGKLFLLPFIRSPKLSIVFGKYFFV